MKGFKLDTVRKQGKIALGLYFLKDYSLFLAVLGTVVLLWLALFGLNAALDFIVPVPQCFNSCSLLGSGQCCLFRIPIMFRGAGSMLLIGLISFAAHRRVKGNRLLFSVMLAGVFCLTVFLYLLELGVGAPAGVCSAVLVFLVIFYGYRASLRVR